MSVNVTKYNLYLYTPGCETIGEDGALSFLETTLKFEKCTYQEIKSFQ